MQNPRNKENLLNYIGQAWTDGHQSLPEGCKIILGGVFHAPERTVLLVRDSCAQLPELSCEKHEEADTGMFAHIAYCVQI